MKPNYLLLLIVFGAGLICCSDDNDGDDKSPVYNFKDQDASGKINYQDFTYADGYANIDEETIQITLSLSQTTQGCAMGIPEGSHVFFFIEKAVKLTPLRLGAKTVTLLEVDGVMSWHWHASDGAVEIISITDTEVSGKIDARHGKETFINGNFTIPLCTS